MASRRSTRVSPARDKTAFKVTKLDPTCCATPISVCSHADSRVRATRQARVLIHTPTKQSHQSATLLSSPDPRTLCQAPSHHPPPTQTGRRGRKREEPHRASLTQSQVVSARGVGGWGGRSSEFGLPGQKGSRILTSVQTPASCQGSARRVPLCLISLYRAQGPPAPPAHT